MHFLKILVCYMLQNITQKGGENNGRNNNIHSC
nr:MAG TPA: hypothetical protein [Caudoviricetes sp.]